ncbi:MAG: response regulator transcription factor [Fibrobacteres bacterium]|jgi:DNA-binding NarL/FixJ family response regulator|nr:response regulator transcription factor [Fibrobacterota bacterium]
MSTGNPISLVMVEDNLDLAQTVEDFLQAEPRLKLAGIAHDSQGFREKTAAHLPELALIDIHLDTPRAGLELLVWLRMHYPVVKPVIMTVNQGDVLEAYQSGARGYVLKTHLEILCDTLLQVAQGHLIIPSEVGELYVKQVAAAAELWKKSAELDRFSDREKEILRLLNASMKREAIADKLGISFFTVRRHIQNMLEKAGEPTVKTLLTRFGKVLGSERA